MRDRQAIDDPPIVKLAPLGRDERATGRVDPMIVHQERNRPLAVEPLS